MREISFTMTPDAKPVMLQLFPEVMFTHEQMEQMNNHRFWSGKIQAHFTISAVTSVSGVIKMRWVPTKERKLDDDRLIGTSRVIGDATKDASISIPAPVLPATRYHDAHGFLVIWPENVVGKEPFVVLVTLKVVDLEFAGLEPGRGISKIDNGRFA